jgi:O-acetylserine/cysteine efflux transporter
VTIASPANGAFLPRSHLLLAVVVMAIWGSNFVVIKIALQHLPPLLLAALRFGFAFLPAACFVPRPKISWLNLAAFGILIGVGQFGLLFLAMNSDITPGLASLVVQVQVFFTIGLSVILSGERVRPYQWTALALATAGLGTILTHTDGTATPLGLAMVIVAAFCWACGSMVTRSAGQVNMLAYVIWSSAFAVPPLIMLALIFEGWPAMSAGLQAATQSTWLAVMWQSIGNTMFGYAIWGWLLARHPASTVAPLALLVPIFGIGSSALILGEPLQGWKLLAAALVVGGLALGILWPRLSASGEPNE